MNKLLKVIVAVLGGINIIFSIMIPVFIVLLIIRTFPLSDLNQLILISVGLLTSFYRATIQLVEAVWIE